jgi:predicted Zn-dependent protease
MENSIEYTNKVTDVMNNNNRYVRQNGSENLQYETEIVDLSKELVQIDQNLLSFCSKIFNSESILPGLVQNLAEAGRARDALLVANECSQRFPNNPYCVAASVEAFHKLNRYTEARAAAERVIRRGPYDAQMEATIAQMRALLALINTEEQLQAVEKKREERR